MKALYTTFFFCAFSALTLNCFSQCISYPAITFINPSFEGPHGIGITPSPWSICMPGKTPDTQPGSFTITMPPDDGNSYLGFVNNRAIGWVEGAAQQLSSPMVSGVPYSFTVALANNAKFLSIGTNIIMRPGPAECQMWGGFGPCDDSSGTGVLLWSSGDITPKGVWITYTASFTPTQNFTWVMFRINDLSCASCTYKPYVQIDNLSSIRPPNVTIADTVVQNITCSNLSNGQVTVHAIGAHNPFSYQWNSTPAQTDSVLDNAPAGSYSVTVTDANSCTTTASFTITQPEPIALTATITDVSCFGLNDGSVDIDYSGGTPPFTFLWNDSITTANHGNLSAGNYSVIATDTNSCSLAASVTISEPLPLSVDTLITVDVRCFGESSGSMISLVSGGTLPFIYKWNTIPIQTTDTAHALVAGIYSVTVTDAKTCTASAEGMVNAPNDVSVTISADDDIICSDDTAMICATTGFALYLWNTGQTDSCIEAKLAGNYYVTVTDNNGCTAESNRLAITVHPSPLVSISVNGDTLSVFNAVAQQWYLNGTEITGATSNIYIANQGGSYTVAITDSNGCRATSNPTIITGIENINEEDVVSVYRLAVDRWQLTVGDNYIGGIAEVYDANGKLVFKSAIRNSQSEIAAGVARGVYLLRISSAKTNKMTKVIKF